MSVSSPFLIVSFESEDLAEVVELVQLLGYPDAQVAAGGLEQAISALRKRPQPPEYLLVDIGNRSQDVLKDIDALAEHCEGDVRVVVIGAINDIVFYRELKSRGVLEYFPKPVTAADIRPVMLQASAKNSTLAGDTKPGTVISVMSAASGDGATTFALNLAYSLAEDYKQPTVLVDMDYQFGLISKSLDLNATFGIKELFDHPERGVDDMLISKMLVDYKGKLSIIAAPNDLRLMPMVKPETIRELVNVLRQQFAFVIIDVPHIWTDWAAATLTYSDHSVMVAQLWLRSLTHASRLMTAWHSIGVTDQDISVVINRSGAKFKEAITSQDFERICRHKITAHINNDIRVISQAENDAKTLMELEESSLLQQQVRQFSTMMCKTFRPEVITGNTQESHAKKGLKLLLKK